MNPINPLVDYFKEKSSPEEVIGMSSGAALGGFTGSKIYDVYITRKAFNRTLDYVCTCRNINELDNMLHHCLRRSAGIVSDEIKKALKDTDLQLKRDVLSKCLDGSYGKRFMIPKVSNYKKYLTSRLNKAIVSGAGTIIGGTGGFFGGRKVKNHLEKRYSF